MKLLLIACSQKAYELAGTFAEKWRERQPQDRVDCVVKCGSLPELSEERTLAECVEEAFFQTDALIFFCAAGIAVRSIAPCIRHKSVDPAVIVVDEAGTYSISLLSGHYGGGNRLAKAVAEVLGAVPVITTATDREGKFAVDLFAADNGLQITDWKAAKRISVELLEGRKVGFFSELPIEGEVPEGLEICPPQSDSKEISMWIFVTDRELWTADGQSGKNMQDRILRLFPKNLYLGIGCRKSIPEEKIEKAVLSCLKQEGLSFHCVAGVASIDLKKEEPGLLSYCRNRKLPFQTFTASWLEKVTGSLQSSAFVERVTGVDNVCERSALAACAGEGKLILGKQICEGVTVAIAEKNQRLRF